MFLFYLLLIEDSNEFAMKEVQCAFCEFFILVTE